MTGRQHTQVNRHVNEKNRSQLSWSELLVPTLAYLAIFFYASCGKLSGLGRVNFVTLPVRLNEPIWHPI